MNWLDAMHQSADRGTGWVLVSVMAVAGSAPCSVGTRMLVTHAAVTGSIGGGRLEHDAIGLARTWLQAGAAQARIEQHDYSLGRDLAQCCGGRVTLLFDYHPAIAQRLEIFGAGHITQALLDIVSQLPLCVRVHDTRDDWLERVRQHAGQRIDTVLLGASADDNPVVRVEGCKADSAFLVMTHSHDLDYDIVQAILSRGDSRYCGLVASRSKAARFRARLLRQGFTDAEIARLNAPIGQRVDGFKQPMAVAVAAAQAVLLAFDTQPATLADDVS